MFDSDTLGCQKLGVGEGGGGDLRSDNPLCLATSVAFYLVAQTLSLLGVAVADPGGGGGVGGLNPPLQRFFFWLVSI